MRSGAIDSAASFSTSARIVASSHDGGIRSSRTETSFGTLRRSQAGYIAGIAAGRIPRSDASRCKPDPAVCRQSRRIVPDVSGGTRVLSLVGAVCILATETGSRLALPDRRRTEGPCLTRSSRSQRLRSGKRGRYLGNVHWSPKGRDAFIAAQRAGRQRVRARRDGVGGCA